MGSCPEWYPLVRASRYLKGAMSPVELASASIAWMGMIDASAEAEAKAERNQRKKENRANRRSSRRAR